MRTYLQLSVKTLRAIHPLFSARYCTITAHCRVKISLFPKKFPSSFVVGYGQNGLNAGASKMLASQFINVSSKTVKITDFNIIPGEGKTMDDIYGTVFFKVLNPNGTVARQYTYINWAGDSGDEIAWVDGFEKISNDVEFAPGQAFWIQSDVAGTQIQCAGIVDINDRNIPLTAVGGSMAIGNPFPSSFVLSDILILRDAEKNSDPDSIYGTVFLKKLQPNGIVDSQYSYINWAGDSGDEIAWVNGFEEISNNEPILPGEGFWVQIDVDGLSLQLPAPEL